jgi:DNA protecting protein DprA
MSLLLMDQVVANHELEYQPLNAMARELGYDREAITFLGLSRLKGIGFQTLNALDGRHGISRLIQERNVSEIVGRAQRPMGAGEKVPGWEEFSHKIWTLGQEMADKLAEHRIHFLFATDPRFPSPLARLPKDLRPKWLFVAGDLRLLERPSLAIVGTRRPTKIGEFLAQYAVSAAKEMDAPVVSGLAEGIDRIVHEWCLNISLPTISVLGTGILAPYPAKHSTLSKAIVDAGGIVMSEYLPTQGPSARQFVWRNRLQAALGRATIAVEWKKKSGTAHTVKFSRRLGRVVIGLALDGALRDAEAGEPDVQFIVPNEHSGLIDALRKSLVRGVPVQDGRQADLFG